MFPPGAIGSPRGSRLACQTLNLPAQRRGMGPRGSHYAGELPPPTASQRKYASNPGGRRLVLRPRPRCMQFVRRSALIRAPSHAGSPCPAPLHTSGARGVPDFPQSFVPKSKFAGLRRSCNAAWRRPYAAALPPVADAGAGRHDALLGAPLLSAQGLGFLLGARRGVDVIGAALEPVLPFVDES